MRHAWRFHTPESSNYLHEGYGEKDASKALAMADFKAKHPRAKIMRISYAGPVQADDLPPVQCGTNIPAFWEMVQVVVDQLCVRGRSEIILWRDKQFNNVFAWDTSVFALPQIEARGEWQKCATFKLHSWHKETKGWKDAWRGAVTDAMGWSWRAQTIWLCAKGAEAGSFRWTSTCDGSPRKTRGGCWVRVMKVTPHVFTK